VGAVLDPKAISDPTLRWLWLYRDGIYATERSPRSSEMGEVVLRVKSLHFQQDQALRRLKEQVANFEAIDTNLKGPGRRTAIPDDVKLLVWSRDGGACVKCGTTKELHFDHIIPYARGGSDAAANIQILCRSCNLAKSDRLL
jgi:5-methylcytosine-specific restriction endonuclease McrA